MFHPATNHAGAGAPSPNRLTIGERVRSARIAANKTQRDAAGDTYSKSYISAIERGKMTPSVQALSVVADHLGLPVSYFLGESEVDLSALAESSTTMRSTQERERMAREETLGLLLTEAEGLIRQGNPDSALEKLGSQETLEELSGLQRPHWYLLEGWAWLLKHEHQKAIVLLQAGLRLAEPLVEQAWLWHQGAATDLAERLRCFLGQAYYELGQPEMALEQHRHCLTALTEGQIADLELTLRIFLALGHAYLLLNRDNDAIDFYEQATEQVQQAEGPAAQGALHWQLGLTYESTGDLARARANLNKALVAFELQENSRQAAQLRSLFGQVLVNLERYQEAEDNLQQSLSAAERTGDASTRASALGNFASMHTARGNHDQAIQMAQEGLNVVKESKDQRTEGQLHLTLAIAYEAKSDFGAAEEELKQAIAIFEKTGDRDLIGRAHEKYGKFLAERERFQDAYEHMKIAQAAGYVWSSEQPYL